MRSLVYLCLLAFVALAAASVYHKEHGGFEQSSYYKKPKKQCYMCAYSPGKTYKDKKVTVEKHDYGYGGSQRGSSRGRATSPRRGYGDGFGRRGGYVRRTYSPVSYHVQGGWDKCLDAFTHEQAKYFGIDIWDCDSNCYIRTDKNGNVFRGCYKGEFGVDPYKFGCHKQAGSIYCFCHGNKCNNGDAAH